MSDIRNTPRRPDLRVIKTRKAMFEAFTELLREKDADSVSVTELTGKANITRKTFYLHYSSMEAFIEDYILCCFESPLEEMVRELTSDKPFDFSGFFRKLNESFDVPERALYSLMESRDVPHILRDAMREQDNSVMSAFTRYYDRDPAKASYYVTFLCVGVYSLYYKWVADGKNISLAGLSAIAEKLYRSWLEAFRNDLSAQGERE